VAKKLELEITFPFWTAYWANLQVVRWSLLQIVVSAVFPLAGLSLVFLWITHRHAVEASDVILVLVCLFFKPLVTLLVLPLARRKNPLSAGPFTYAFDSEGIHVSGSAFSMSIKPTAILKVRESGSFIFLFISPGHAQTLPVDQLRASGVLNELREWCRLNVSDAKFR
jgi:hypothetical protein